ncbi:MAG TPA: GIY-YIG nuclease family protein [Candidatus Paceibacterota bacterium]
MNEPTDTPNPVLVGTLVSGNAVIGIYSHQTDWNEIMLRRELKKMPTIEPKPSKVIGIHTVYRLYDDADRLLYVGYSSNLFHRLRRHRQKAEWWPQVELVRIDECPTKPDALSIERQYIWYLHPAFNASGQMVVVDGKAMPFIPR